MVKVILFDLDDTLISEDQYVRSGYRYVARVLAEKYGIEANQAEKELYKEYLENKKNVFNRYLDKCGILYSDMEIKELVMKYRNHFPDIEYFQDVKPLLTKLKSKGIRLGIISDGYLYAQKKKAEAISLDEDFEKIIFTDELGMEYWKPSVKAFELMKDYFEVEYCEMIYVGDNPQKDFYVKKSIPIITVRICREKAIYEKAEYLENIREDLSIRNLEELAEKIAI